jgi:hypothetical protein
MSRLGSRRHRSIHFVGIAIIEDQSTDSREEIVMPTIGFKLDARPSEDVLRLARSVEQAGFSELWVCEDLGLE